MNNEWNIKLNKIIDIYNKNKLNKLCDLDEYSEYKNFKWSHLFLIIYNDFYINNIKINKKLINQEKTLKNKIKTSPSNILKERNQEIYNNFINNKIFINNNIINILQLIKKDINKNDLKYYKENLSKSFVRNL